MQVGNRQDICDMSTFALHVWQYELIWLTENFLNSVSFFFKYTIEFESFYSFKSGHSTIMQDTYNIWILCHHDSGSHFWEIFSSEIYFILRFDKDKPTVPGEKLKKPAVPDPDLQYKGLHKKDKQKQKKKDVEDKLKKDPRGEDWYENPRDFDGKVSNCW